MPGRKNDTMIVPKKNRLAIYSFLFKEGVICAEKTQSLRKHEHVEVPNIHVLQLMRSLKSRDFVKENFSWQWFYYSLTNEGIEYLREYLHVSGDTVPNTLKKASKPQPPPSFGNRRNMDSGDRRPRGDRDGYRGAKKMDGAPGDFKPSYGGMRGGRGGMRGRRGGFGGRAGEQ